MLRIFKFFIILATLFDYFQVQAQPLYYIKGTVDFMDIVDTRKFLENESQKNYTGSPYLNENFIAGELYYNDQFVYQDIQLRYNIYNDVLEYLNKRNGVAYNLDPTNKINKVIIGKDTFVVDSLLYGNKIKYCYFKLLYSGQVTLLVKMKVVLIPRKNAQLYTEATLAKFARNVDSYYARVAEQPLQKVKKIKSLIALINDRNKALTEFAKKEKLRNKPEDMVKLADYYESLNSPAISSK